MPSLEEAQLAAQELFGSSLKVAIRKDRKHLEYIASGKSSIYEDPRQIANAKVLLAYKDLARGRFKGD